MFIRYNPYEYVPKESADKIEGDSFDKRMFLLGNWIKHFLTTPPTVPLSVGYLYFDGWEQWNKLNIDIPII